MSVPPKPTADLDYDAVAARLASLAGKQIFFIGGAPKSGTTWLQLLLDAHPEISCGGEGHYADKLVGFLQRACRDYNAFIQTKNRGIFDGIYAQPTLDVQDLLFLSANAVLLMLSRQQNGRDAAIIGDKTPDNVLMFPTLAAIFPRAKFIHIIRDGRDCAISAWFHNKRINSPQFAEKFPSMAPFLAYFAGVWVDAMKTGHSFAAAVPDRCLAVRYEDLCAQPVATLARITGFLGASCDETLLEACHRAAGFETLTGGRAPGQEDRDSFFRQGMSGNWRRHFDTMTELEFRTRAEPWLSRLRYT